MAKVLVIGCGGVASVAIRKCCMRDDVFTELCIASRTLSKCDALKAKLGGKTKTKITTAQVDADKTDEVIALIKRAQPDLVMNIALPYQDLAIMDACLACGVNYLDTANYEPENTDDPVWREKYEKRCKEEGFSAYFDYTWQWAYGDKYKKAGLTALLGSGFDPGVTQVFCAYAQKHLFDTIETIDILDCNGGDHGYPFATNFNPEINLREVSAPGSYWENGRWVEVPAMSIHRTYNFDGVGEKDMYLLHHEEIESLAKNIKGVKRIRFFMTFGQSYLTHMKCLENVGMLSTTEGAPARSRVARPAHRRQDEYRLHLYGREGRQAQDGVHLQRLRPPGMLPRSRIAGDLLHDGRTRHDRRDDARHGQVEQKGRLHPRRVRPRSVHGGAEQERAPLEDRGNSRAGGLNAHAVFLHRRKKTA